MIDAVIAETTDTADNSDWLLLIERFTGLKPETPAWKWLFSERWHETDPTRRGAAARIRTLIDHGVPHNADAQRTGNAPLCYRHRPPTR